MFLCRRMRTCVNVRVDVIVCAITQACECVCLCIHACVIERLCVFARACMCMCVSKRVYVHLNRKKERGSCIDTHAHTFMYPDDLSTQEVKTPTPQCLVS